MAYSNNPNGEILQTVEPERHPFRWLWWLLVAAILAGLIWALAWACTRPAEVPGEIVDTPAPAATATPGELIEPGQISFSESALEEFRTAVDGTGLSANVDEDHLYSGFQQICADHLNGSSTLPDAVATAFGLASITEGNAEELNHVVTANPALCLMR